MIVAALWIVFLVGFAAGCAWANAVRTPAPPDTPPNTEPLHVCPLDGGYCACVPPFGCQPRMSDYSQLTAIANRHNSDIGARN